jgi:hypothetical protein
MRFEWKLRQMRLPSAGLFGMERASLKAKS